MIGRFVRKMKQSGKKLSAQEIEDEKQKEEQEQKECSDAIIFAFKHGYRHIDSAQAYNTEVLIGKALKQLFADKVCKREEVFIATKVGQSKRTPQEVRDSIDKSLADFDLKYIDLFLIHSPHSKNKEGERGKDVIETYKIMHEYRKQGKIKSVGVSNFGIKHLEILEKACPDLPLPVVNQIENHPFLQETEIIEYCTKKGIKIESYSPIGQGGKGGIKDHAYLAELGKKYNKTWAQIMLRWNFQSGYIPIPKSTKTERIRQNADIFDIEFTAEEMVKLTDLKKEKRRIMAEWNWVPMRDVIWDEAILGGDDKGGDDKE